MLLKIIYARLCLEKRQIEYLGCIANTINDTAQSSSDYAKLQKTINKNSLNKVLFLLSKTKLLLK